MTEEQDRFRVLDRCLLARGREGVIETLRPFERNEEVRELLAFCEGFLGDSRLVRN